MMRKTTCCSFCHARVFLTKRKADAFEAKKLAFLFTITTERAEASTHGKAHVELDVMFCSRLCAFPLRTRGRRMEMAKLDAKAEWKYFDKRWNEAAEKARGVCCARESFASLSPVTINSRHVVNIKIFISPVESLTNVSATIGGSRRNIVVQRMCAFSPDAVEELWNERSSSTVAHLRRTRLPSRTLSISFCEAPGHWGWVAENRWTGRPC